MRRPRAKLVAIVLVLLLARTNAAADPQHIETSEVRLMCVPPVPAARCIELQPGHFVDAGSWTKLDAAIRTAQDRVTGLAAENASLRASAAGWQPGWKALASAVLTGVGLGWYLRDKL